MTEMRTARWAVDITLAQREGHTHAEARLHTRDDTHLVGTGVARRRPTDRDVPEIGDEIAVARALIELAENLLHVAASDIEGVTDEKVRLDH